MFSFKHISRAACLIIAAIFVLIAAGCEANDEKNYLIAQERLVAGDYDGAAEIFTELGEYENSAEMVNECSYAKAGALLDAGEYDSAADIYGQLGSYKDSADMVIECAYAKAASLLEAGEYDSAADIYGQLGSYKDSADMVIECSYAKAASLLDAGEYDSAAELFASLLNYKDSSDMVNECSYAKADDLYNTGEYYAAAQLFLELGEYKDSHDRCLGAWHKFRPGNTIGATTNCIAAIKNDGTVLCTNPSEYKGIDEWTDIFSLSFGLDYIVGLRFDGTVVAAGNNEYGNCNVEDWTDIVMVSVYSNPFSGGPGYLTVGLRADGTVVCVGLTDESAFDKDETAFGEDESVFGKEKISEWTDIVCIATGSTITIGIKADGTTVVAGGFYLYDDDVLEWTDVTYAFCGAGFYVGLKSDGTAVGCGDNGTYALYLDDWNNLVDICADSDSTVGLKSDGTVVYSGQYTHEYLEFLQKSPYPPSGPFDEYDFEENVSKLNNIADIFFNGSSTLICLNKDSTLDIVTIHNNLLEYNGHIDTALTWTDLKLPE